MKCLLLLPLTIALTACSPSGGQITAKESAQAERHQITAKEFGAAYPFTVDGYLECEPPGAIVFKSGGKAYAVNGTAQNKGYPAIDPIWKDDPANPGKINIIDVLVEGQKLCKQ